MAGLFDDVLEPTSSDASGLFDDILKPKPIEGGLIAAAKSGFGSAVKGAGQAAGDFIPGVSNDNALKRYGQGVIDANPTAVRGFDDLYNKPWTAIKEAIGNAGGSVGQIVAARAIGQGITAAAPFTGPLAPVTAAVGQAIAWFGPAAIAALPSYGSIRDKQILNDPASNEDWKSKAIATLGAGAVGAIEAKFGPQEWALGAMSREGRSKLAEKFAETTLAKGIGFGALKGAAIEGAEELVQNPIEQLASYEDPTSSASLKETAFGGVMGAIGGGVLGGATGAVFRSQQPAAPDRTADILNANDVDTAIATSQQALDEVSAPLLSSGFDLLSGQAENPLQEAMRRPAGERIAAPTNTQPAELLDRQLIGANPMLDMARAREDRAAADAAIRQAEEARVQSELDAIPAIAADQNTTQGAVQRAATLEAPNALELAFQRAKQEPTQAPAPLEPATPEAPTEPVAEPPRLIDRAPGLLPMSLARAEQVAAKSPDMEVVRFPNINRDTGQPNGKFSYTVITKETDGTAGSVRAVDSGAIGGGSNQPGPSVLPGSGNTGAAAPAVDAGSAGSVLPRGSVPAVPAGVAGGLVGAVAPWEAGPKQGAKSSAQQAPAAAKADGEKKLPPTDIRMGDTVRKDGVDYVVSGGIDGGVAAKRVVASQGGVTEDETIFLKGDDAIAARIAAKTNAASATAPRRISSSNPIVGRPGESNPTIVDAQGREYRVHSQRNNLVVSHPIVEGKAVVNSSSAVRFWTNPDMTPSGENDRTDPIFQKEQPTDVPQSSQAGTQASPQTGAQAASQAGPDVAAPAPSRVDAPVPAAGQPAAGSAGAQADGIIQKSGAKDGNQTPGLRDQDLRPTNPEAGSAEGEAVDARLKRSDEAGAKPDSAQASGVDQRLIPVSKRVAPVAPDNGHIGANNIPIAEGGKPFKTKKGADLARKMNPMLRAKQVQGGYVLAPKSEAPVSAKQTGLDTPEDVARAIQEKVASNRRKYPAANPLDVPTDAQTQSADAAVDALTDEEALAVAQRMGKKIPARGDAKDAIKQEHPDDIYHGLAGDTWNGKDWTPSDEPTKATANQNQAEIFDVPADATPAKPAAEMSASELLRAAADKMDAEKVAPTPSGYRKMDQDGRPVDRLPVKAGDQFETASGRTTSAYPKQKSEKYASQWLIDNATEEAKSRGDKFNARIFSNTTMLKQGQLTDGDRASMLEYLFGQQPAVLPSILRPLNGETERGTMLFSRSDAANKSPEKIASDLTASYKSIRAAIPEIDNYAYDFTKQQFVSTAEGDPGVRIVADPAAELVGAARAAGLSAGSSTIQRAILTGTLIRGQDLLQAVRETVYQGLPGNLNGLLYGQAQNPAPSTPIATIRESLTKAYGKLASRLESKGLLSIHQTQDEAMQAAALARADARGTDVETEIDGMRGSIDAKDDADGRTQGFYDPITAKSFLIADNLTSDTAPGVLIHEIGIHAAADGTIDPLHQRAAELVAGDTSDFMRDVANRMDAAGESSPEEAAAYIAEAYENNRLTAPKSVRQWIANYIAAIRGWLYKKGILIASSDLTPADIAAIARANARAVAEGGAAMGDGGLSMSESGESISPGSDFWRKIKDGESFTDKELEDVYSQGRRGTERALSRMDRTTPEGARNPGEEVATWSGTIAGFDGYKTVGVTTEDGTFIVGVIPEEIFRGSDQGSVESTAIVSYRFIEVGGKYRLDINDADPTGEAFAELHDRGTLEATGRAKLEDRYTTSRELLQEAVRRLALHIGEVPAIIQGDRETGSRAGSFENREIGPDRVAMKFSQPIGKDQTKTEAFKRWFGDSKVVDSQGRPLVVYHGTAVDFDAFNPDKQGSNFDSYEGAFPRDGFWFTDSPSNANWYAHVSANGLEGERDGGGQRTMPIYLSIKNPYRYTAEMFAEEGEAGIPAQHELVAQGYDGMIVELTKDDESAAIAVDEYVRKMLDKYGSAYYSWSKSDQDGLNKLEDATTVRDHTHYVAFNPSQIKSATGNNGQFDPANPDIRRSRAAIGELKQQAQSVYNAAANTPGKLGWWHKTVGTQYNLAQRSPEFKRVYDAVQSFLNDVSFFATESADLAPTILPKLENWRDIAKSPLSAADTKAISAPIFEGTLTWMRDESGKPVKVAGMEEQAQALTSEQKAQRLLRNNKISANVLKMWKGMEADKYDAAVSSKYENDMLKAGIVWTDQELTSLFNLNADQISLYREFRKATDKSLTALAMSDMLYVAGDDAEPIRDAVLASATPMEAAETIQKYLLSVAEYTPDRNDELLATADTMIDKAAKVQDLIDRGYAPLSRFGNYTLDVVDDTGERVYFGLFEGRFEAEQMAKKMREMHPGANVTQGTLSEQSYKLFSGVSPETVALFGGMMGLDGNPAYQEYIKLAKSSRSALKRLIERKGIAGFSEDAGRVLAGFVYSNARQTSQNLHAGEMSDAANAIPQQQGELKDHAVNLVEYIKNPQQEAQKIRGLLFAQYIGGSVASAMVNMTQPLTMTLPWLSQYGGITKAAKQMAAAVVDANKKTTGDAALDAALKRAEEDGTVSPQEVHDLMRQAQGNGALQSGDGSAAGDAYAKSSNMLSIVSFAWGKLFSAAEQFNRRSTFIAAYRTAVEQGLGDPSKFAEQAIAETQGIYNKGNKPEWARGSVGSILFTFKQYSIAYVEMLSRMATAGKPGSPERAAGQRSALYALGVLMLLSGAGGLPGADDLDDLISGLMQALGYNFDSKSKRKAFLVEHLGTGGADFVERGLSGLPGAPIDVSGRLGLGNLIPGTGLLTKKQDHTRDVLEFVGPAGDLFKRGFESAGKVVTGDIMGKNGAVATLAPKAMQNLFQAADMEQMGMYRDQTGKKVIDTDSGDALAKALGFQPGSVKRSQDASFEVQRMVGLNKINESRIVDKWAQGLFEKDPEKVQEARDELAQWNKNNPESPIRVKSQQIFSRVANMRMTKQQRIAKTAPAEIRREVYRELAQQ